MDSTEQKTVEQLLAGEACFFIPEYQREYCWDEERCKPLWDDLVDIAFRDKGKKDIFLGTFVTNTRRDGSDRGCDVVDGQQRITTFYLILRAGYQFLCEQWGEDGGKIVCEDDSLKKIR